ncbi:hypothetical protein DFQ29_001024 [Apophysomyces sp. BC1021]|nr:hypothetical protein DFQ29_001024 [Apophysomyces sp. BC1021]
MDIDSVEHTLFSFIGYEHLDEGELADVLEITEENDVDEDEEREEDDDEDRDKGIEENIDDTEVKDNSRRRINCLKVVLKKLVQDSSIDGDITPNEVRKMCHLSDLSKKEEVVCMIANFLRPFAPTNEFADVKKPPGGIVGNAILRAAGYYDFARSICPEVGLSDIHAVALDEASMYETLCYGTTGARLSVCDAGLQPITSISAARKNKGRVLFSFFDADRINGVCATYGLKFCHRVIITAQNIAILDRNVVRKCPVVSAYDEKRKKGQAKRNDSDLTLEFEELTNEEALATIESFSNEIKQLEIQTKILSKKTTAADEDVHSAKSEYKKDIDQGRE